MEINGHLDFRSWRHVPLGQIRLYLWVVNTLELKMDQEGIEPSTSAMRMQRSTDELLAPIFNIFSLF